jgi:glycerol-3-phosphate dehydrogenase
MHRDLQALSTRRFDLLVVGGGIYGLIIACDAAQRGLTVALIERGDFASGSSFNHLRTIHGGLRYLQTMDVARARESIVERRTLASIAPDAVMPLPFALPLSLSLTRGKTAMRIAFAIDALLAHDRNIRVTPSHHVPHGRVLSLAETFERFPELRTVPRIRGAAVWHDYVTTHAEPMRSVSRSGGCRRRSPRAPSLPTMSRR